MDMKIATLAATLALAALAAGPAAAQGTDTDPNSSENVIPAPSADNPSDPAAGSNPAAREPTAPGTSSDPNLGASGAGEGTAGQAVDPNADDNKNLMQKPMTSDPSGQ
jgi:hypothetical protein